MFYTIKKKKKILTKFQQPHIEKKPIVSIQHCSLAVRSIQHNIISITLMKIENISRYLSTGSPKPNCHFQNEDNMIMLCWNNNALGSAKKVQKKHSYLSNGFMDLLLKYHHKIYVLHLRFI